MTTTSPTVTGHDLMAMARARLAELDRLLSELRAEEAALSGERKVLRSLLGLKSRAGDYGARLRAILEAGASGEPFTVDDLRPLQGFSGASQIADHVTHGVRQGLVVRLSRGRYQLTEAGLEKARTNR